MEFHGSYTSFVFIGFLYLGGYASGSHEKQRIRKSAHAILFADLIIDKPVFRVYNTRNFIYCSSATCFALKLAENSESGQNPERYRHCMRGGAARDESQSLGFFLRRQCGRLTIRESGDLLETSLLCIPRNYGMDSLFVMGKRPW